MDHAGRFRPIISSSPLTLLKTTSCTLVLTLNNYLFVLRKQHEFGQGDGHRTLLIKKRQTRRFCLQGDFVSVMC